MAMAQEHRAGYPELQKQMPKSRHLLNTSKVKGAKEKQKLRCGF